MIIQIETLNRYSKADSGKRYNAKVYLYPFVLMDHFCVNINTYTT